MKYLIPLIVSLTRLVAWMSAAKWSEYLTVTRGNTWGISWHFYRLFVNVVLPLMKETRDTYRQSLNWVIRPTQCHCQTASLASSVHLSCGFKNKDWELQRLLMLCGKAGAEGWTWVNSFSECRLLPRLTFPLSCYQIHYSSNHLAAN